MPQGVRVVVTCWSAKGGSGATTVAVALACLVAAAGRDVTLVDLCGDVPAALGRPEPRGPGLAGALDGALTGAGPELSTALARGAELDAHGISVIARGEGPLQPADGDRLATALAAQPATVVVDAGTVAASTGADASVALALAAAASHSLLVLRPCYLALRRATALPIRPSGIILVGEPGRSLGRADVESVLGVRVTAEIPWDASIARALDSGLLATRVPSLLADSLRRAA